jgi:hypothetical protein
MSTKKFGPGYETSLAAYTYPPEAKAMAVKRYEI